MFFVPLPLFATLFLTLLLVQFMMQRDMALRAHQFFAGLVGLYVVQSMLSVLRWGYGFEILAEALVLIAPVLPVACYMSFCALSQEQRSWQLWPVGIVLLNWTVWLLAQGFADATILVTYLGFGCLLLVLARRGPDLAAVSPLVDAEAIVTAAAVIGVGLIASGLTDIFVIYDFLTNEGRNAGVVVSFVQTGFLLLIGVMAVRTRAAPDPEPAAPGVSVPFADADEFGDAEILSQIDALFKTESLQRDEDLSLRRLARRLGQPDRRVSNAINRGTGMSVSQFVNEARVREACELLSATDKSVLEVSLTSGFATRSNFNREFQRVVGMTPTQWRQRGGSIGMV